MVDKLPSYLVLNAGKSDFEEHPELIFPTASSSKTSLDLYHFPNFENIRWRHQQGMHSFWSQDFLSAVKNATQVIQIIDSYFLLDDLKESSEKSIDRLLELMCETQVLKLEILTSTRALPKDVMDDFKGLTSEIRNERQQINSTFDFEVKLLTRKSSAIVPHDRFAIIDEELWHCGASIGGLHKQLNVMSCGWSAEKRRAKQYFRELWELAEPWEVQ